MCGGGALSPCGVGEASQRVAALVKYRVLPPPSILAGGSTGQAEGAPLLLMAGAALRSKGWAPTPPHFWRAAVLGKQLLGSLCPPPQTLVPGRDLHALLLEDGDERLPDARVL